MTIFSFGSDPEFVIQNKDSVKSAIGILPAKENALESHGNQIYYDNVLAEIAIKPAFDKSELVENTYSALKFLADYVYPYTFHVKSALDYPNQEINCDAARIAGCNPEWDVYSLQMIEPPSKLIDSMDGYYQFKSPFRTAGGHIHVGSNFLLNQLKTLSFIRMMDLFVGIPSIFLDSDPTSKKRRKAYGKAGSHRTPEYGIEYRTLGNFWLSSPKLVELIYDLTTFAVEFTSAGEDQRFWAIDEDLLDSDDPTSAYKCFGYDVNLMRKCIDECDKTQAEKFMLFISNYLPDELMINIESLVNRDMCDTYKAWGL